MEAVRLRQFDLTYRNHVQAFLNAVARSKKSAGNGRLKPVYTRFDKFFDYEKELNKVKNAGKPKQKSRFAGIGKFLNKGG